MTRSIGGRLDYGALLGRDQHRPVDRATTRAAAVELRARGLTPLDIADALKLSEAAIRELLGESAP